MPWQSGGRHVPQTKGIAFAYKQNICDCQSFKTVGLLESWKATADPEQADLVSNPHACLPCVLFQKRTMKKVRRRKTSLDTSVLDNCQVVIDSRAVTRAQQY